MFNNLGMNKKEDVSRDLKLCKIKSDNGSLNKILSITDETLNSFYGNVDKSHLFNIARSSHQRCSMKKGVLRNSTKFTGKHLAHLINKVEHLWTIASISQQKNQQRRKPLHQSIYQTGIFYQSVRPVAR